MLHDPPAKAFKNGVSLVKADYRPLLLLGRSHIDRTGPESGVGHEPRYPLQYPALWHKGSGLGTLAGACTKEIKAAILREGLSEYEAVRYFTLSGPLKISAVQGADLVTGLNWAMRILLRHAPLLDESRFSQPQVTCLMNDEVYCAAESSKSGTPREFFLAGFRCL